MRISTEHQSMQTYIHYFQVPLSNTQQAWNFLHWPGFSECGSHISSQSYRAHLCVLFTQESLGHHIAGLVGEDREDEAAKPPPLHFRKDIRLDCHKDATI